MDNSLKLDLDAELDALISEAEKERDENNGIINVEKNEIDNTQQSDVGGDININANSENQENIEVQSGTSNENENQEQSTDSLKVNVNGVNMNFNSKEEIAAFITKSTKKPIDMLATNGISKEDLILLKDIKAGNISAIKKVINENQIDLIDIEDHDGEYTPVNGLYEPTELDYVVSEVASNVELQSKLERLATILPNDFKQVVGTNAQDYRMFAMQVESGIAEPVIAEALKQHTITGRPFIELYNEVGHRMFGVQSANQTPAVNTPAVTKQKKQPTARELEIRRMARTNNNNYGNVVPTGADLSVDDMWNMTYDELMNLDLRDI